MTVIGEVPTMVGVPERTPAVLRARPAGNAPDSVQASGGNPAVAEKVKLYGRFTTPKSGGGVVLIVGVGGLMTVMVKFCGAVFWPSASCTTTAMGNEPVVAVVPDNTPLVLKAKVAGRLPISLQVNGASPPLAAKEKL